MDLVIDIQGFVGIEGEFIPKEVALVSLDNTYIGHWILQPHVQYHELPKSVRRVNNWISKSYHGIDWYEGDVNGRKWKNTLREITRSAGRIFVRGHNKASYLQDVIAREIINLEQTYVPSFENLPLDSNERCFLHGTQKKEFDVCALSNAFKLRKFLLSSSDSPLLNVFRHFDEIDKTIKCHFDKCEKKEEEEEEEEENVNLESSINITPVEDSGLLIDLKSEETEKTNTVLGLVSSVALDLLMPEEKRPPPSSSNDSDPSVDEVG